MIALTESASNMYMYPHERRWSARHRCLGRPRRAFPRLTLLYFYANSAPAVLGARPRFPKSSTLRQPPSRRATAAAAAARNGSFLEPQQVAVTTSIEFPCHANKTDLNTASKQEYMCKGRETPPHRSCVLLLVSLQFTCDLKWKTIILLVHSTTPKNCQILFKRKDQRKNW